MLETIRLQLDLVPRYRDAVNRRRAATMGEARRKRNGTGHSFSDPLQRIRPIAVAAEAVSGVRLPTVDLDQLLLNRGWIAVDRGDGHAMYD
jgi:hypothetical protein